MAPIAIAGGTSYGLGRSLVHGLLSQTPHHQPIVLSRSSSSIPAWLEPLVSSGKVTVRRVDYSSQESMIAALEGVHTLISVLLPPDGSGAKVQSALLEAAVAAGVKRFAPTEFGTGVDAVAKISVTAFKAEVWQACEKSGLEWTRFNCGMFMNYLGFGAVRDKKEAMAARDDDPFLLFDFDKYEAELPLDDKGEIASITLTETMDVGKFVARACDLEKWDDTNLSMAGETLKVNEVIETLKRVTGKTWKGVPVTEQQLKERKEKETDWYKSFWLELYMMVARNTVGEGVLDGKLNNLFPDVETMTVEKFAKRYLV